MEQKMKFGFYTTPQKFSIAAALKPDYLDIVAVDLLPLGDEEFAAFADTVKQSGVEVYSAICLVPGDLRLTGAVDFDEVRTYSEKMFARLGALGVRVVVFGSGKAKEVPEGFSREEAWRQLYRVAEIFADEAAKYGQIIVIEPLRRSEVNIVNTVEEAAAYAAAVARDNVYALADFYHLNENGEPLSTLADHKDALRHIHLCSPRRDMTTAEDAAFVKERLQALREIGYTGYISYEGGMPDNYAGVPEMLASWRKMYEA